MDPDPESLKLTERLFSAIKLSDTETVKSIAEEYRHNSTLISEMKCGDALIAAARTTLDCVEIVYLLLGSMNANVSHKDQNGLQALHYAAFNNHHNILCTLLQAGAEVNCLDNRSYTPIHYACLQGHVEIVKTLITRGAAVCMRRKTWKESPLHVAAYDGHLEVVLILLENGGDPNERSDLGDWGTPVHRAVAGGHIEVLKALMAARGSIYKADRKGRHPVHKAAGQGHVDVLQLLLKNGASLNLIDNAGMTGLTHAVCSKNPEAAEILLLHGADVSIPDNQKMFPLHYAAMENKPHLVKLLLEHGARVNETNSVRKSSALGLAASLSFPNVVRELCKGGADVNQRDKNKCTPLHNAVSASATNRSEVISILLQYGALLDVQDFGGYTPLERCVFQCVTHNFNFDDLKLLVGAGAPLQYRRLTGGPRGHHSSALTWVVWHSQTDAATYLVNAGWDLRAESWIFETRWNLAQKDILEMILQHLREPRNLSILCRNAVRLSLMKKRKGREILSSIEQLPLPNSVKNFLRVEDG